MDNQPKIESLVEALLSTLIGFSIAILSQIIIFPLYGVEVPLTANFAIAVWFTLISIIRGYAVRRWCNQYLHKIAVALASKLPSSKATVDDVPATILPWRNTPHND